MPETVTIENTPQTEAAASAAQVAQLAAEAALATANQLSAQSASAAERAVAEISESVADDLAEQERDLTWLRSHAESSGAAINETREALNQFRGQMESFQTATLETLETLRGTIQSLIPPPPVTGESLPPEQTPPAIPPEGVVDPPAVKPPRKRRLI